jgi:hypothetical protein
MEAKKLNQEVCSLFGIDSSQCSKLTIEFAAGMPPKATADIYKPTESELMDLLAQYKHLMKKSPPLTKEQWQEMDAASAKMQDAAPRNENPWNCEDLRKEFSSIAKILKTQLSEGAPDQPKPMPDGDNVAQTVNIMADEFKSPPTPWQKQDFDVFHKIFSENNRALESLQNSVKSIKIPKPDYYWLAIASLVANGALVIFILSKMVSQ